MRTVILAGLAVIGMAEWAVAQDDPKLRDLQQAAEKLVADIGPKIAAKAPASGKFRLAVFPVGDKTGKVTPQLGMAPQILQGAIQDVLRAQLGMSAPGKFSVLTPEGLRVSFETLALDPAGISFTDVAATKAILAKASIQVGIVASFDIDSSTARLAIRRHLEGVVEGCAGQRRSDC